MHIYKTLPESFILSKGQIADLNQLYQSLSLMKDWLESNNYRGTTVAPVAIAEPRWPRKKAVTEQQRFYELRVPISVAGKPTYPISGVYAVNINGDLLIGGPILSMAKRKADINTKIETSWASADIVGIFPGAAIPVIHAIEKAIVSSV